MKIKRQDPVLLMWDIPCENRDSGFGNAEKHDSRTLSFIHGFNNQNHCSDDVYYQRGVL